MVKYRSSEIDFWCQMSLKRTCTGNETFYFGLTNTLDSNWKLIWGRTKQGLGSNCILELTLSHCDFWSRMLWVVIDECLCRKLKIRDRGSRSWSGWKWRPCVRIMCLGWYWWMGMWVVDFWGWNRRFDFAEMELGCCFEEFILTSKWESRLGRFDLEGYKWVNWTSIPRVCAWFDVMDPYIVSMSRIHLRYRCWGQSFYKESMVVRLISKEPDRLYLRNVDEEEKKINNLNAWNFNEMENVTHIRHWCKNLVKSEYFSQWVYDVSKYWQN